MLDITPHIGYLIYMNELDIIHTEARIKHIKAVIANTRANSTNVEADEIAIEELALPELARAEKRLADLKASSTKLDKFINKLEARHTHLNS